MTEKILETAEAEAKALRAEIEKTPAARRLRAVEKFIGEYRSIEPAERIVASRSSLRFGRHRGSVAWDLKQASEAYLKKVRRRAKAREIADALVERGVKIPGKNAVSTLSSYLSTCDVFDNIKGKGYGLRELSLNETPRGSEPSGQVPLPGDAERTVPNARRVVAGGTEGK